MSPRRRGPAVPLAARIDALAGATELLDGVAPALAVDAARELLDRIDHRRALSAEHTVIGVFGATGSGKSSLVNALVGSEVTRAAVRRPTTARPVAAVLGQLGADPLLDWLGVEQRRLLDGTGTALEAAAAPRRRREEEPPGIVLLDLPDLDSREAAHRALAEHMTGMVDVIVWVTDPQKYADAVLHRDFVRPFAGHDAVTVLVLNQLDRIRAVDRPAVLDSLGALARRDGLETAPVLGTSAETGEGVAALREVLVDIARTREAAAARQRADVTAAARHLRAAADPAGLPARVPAAAIRALDEDLRLAARVEPVVAAVGASYRHRAAARVGWPPLRWLSRLRPDPLRRLGIAQGREANTLERTSLPEPDAATRARASGGVRAFADASSAGGSDPWRAAVRRAARAREEELPDGLDQAVAEADLRGRDTSWWWPGWNLLQWLALLCAVVGLGWLALNAVLGFLGIPQPPMPRVEELWVPIPLPTVLLALGVGAGVLLAVAGGTLAALASAGRARRARRILRDRVHHVADALVVQEVAAELDRGRRAASDLARAEGGDGPGRV